MLSFLKSSAGAGFNDWDEDLLRSLVPLDRLTTEFLESSGQELDATNGYATTTHLRRILNPNGSAILPDTQIGRICPVDMPENSDFLGRVLTIQSGRLYRGWAPQGCFHCSRGSARAGRGTLPFIHHTDPLRAQIGVNRMRQWRIAARHEPALVQTGLEPEDPRHWIGCNLLTAFASHGKDTYEDSCLMSQSAAMRLGFDAESGIGTLLSNRSGQTGAIGAVLPDDRMPRLSDGTPVELMVSFLGIHTRMNAGQILEAAAGWIARRTGKPYLAVPFAEGDRERIGRELPDTPYRQRLSLGKGVEAESDSIVGWVYWGICTSHASNRLMVPGVIGEGAYLRQGEMENHVLIHRRAYRTIQERFTTLASENTKEPGWSVLFGNLRRRLAAAGISVVPSDRGMTFKLAEPEGDVLRLESPLEHPWLPGHTVRMVGRVPGIKGFEDLEKMNRSFSEGRNMPASLREGRVEHLQILLDGCFGALLTAHDMRMGNRVLRSSRGMISVGVELAFDQVGIPRRMADALFRGELPEWVVINHAPTIPDTAIVAFHPVVVAGDAVRLNPYVCRWMDADYDGDCVAVLVPGSAETQEEVGRLLSVLGHVNADPDTLDTFAPNQEALWGLASLWLSPEGREEMQRILPALGSSDEPPTRKGTSSCLAGDFGGRRRGRSGREGRGVVGSRLRSSPALRCYTGSIRRARPPLPHRASGNGSRSLGPARGALPPDHRG